jgi:hypothetical protein
MRAQIRNVKRARPPDENAELVGPGWLYPLRGWGERFLLRFGYKEERHLCFVFRI